MRITSYDLLYTHNETHTHKSYFRQNIKFKSQQQQKCVCFLFRFSVWQSIKTFIKVEILFGLLLPYLQRNKLPALFFEFFFLFVDVIIGIGATNDVTERK